MKKGFTLVELLAVIVVLSLLMALAIPTTLNLINKSRNNTAKRNEDALKEAAKTLAIRVEDATDDELQCGSPAWIKCSGGTISFTVKNLKDEELFIDHNNNCDNDGLITVARNEKGYVVTFKSYGENDKFKSICNQK